MAEDIQVLKQRADKHQGRLEEISAVISLVQQRLEGAAAAEKEASEQHHRLSTRVDEVKRELKTLKLEAKEALHLAAAAREDRESAERELTAHTRKLEKRKAKLAATEAALAAAQAADRVAQEEPTADPAPRKATARKPGTANPTRTTSKRAAAKSTTGRRATSAGSTRSGTAKATTSTRSASARRSTG